MDLDADKAAAVVQRLQIRDDKRRAQAEQGKANQRQVIYIHAQRSAASANLDAYGLSP